MVKMTRAEARRRLHEAEAKFKKVYLAWIPGQFQSGGRVVKTPDMEAVEKIVARCIKRIG